MVVSETASERVSALLQDREVLDVKLARLANHEVLARVLLDVSQSERVLDLLSKELAETGRVVRRKASALGEKVADH